MLSADRGTTFIPALEAARGVAALTVALFHVSQAKFTAPDGALLPLVGGSNPSWDMRVLLPLANGHGAVVFFFVLSGFVLALLLKRRPDEPVQFALNRVFRIYPAVISTLLLFVAVYAVTGKGLAPPESYSTWNVLANMALLKSDIDGVMWSLQLEMIAAPLILVTFYTWRRWGLMALAAPFFALVGVSFIGEWVLIFGGAPPLALLYAFIAGMFACLYGQRLVQTIGFSRTLLAVYSIGFLAARPLAGWGSNWSGLIETLFACGIVAQLAYGPFPRRAVPALSYYGRISYSFYLLHPLSLIALASYPDRIGALVQFGVPRTLVTVALFLVSVGAITVVSHLQQAFVERPGLLMGKAIGRAVRGR